MHLVSGDTAPSGQLTSGSAEWSGHEAAIGVLDGEGFTWEG
jgi:hypothetical protein